ncbi:MAG: Rieske 2Fe-2S domain-containing protein [Chlamydiota bacterium]
MDTEILAKVSDVPLGRSISVMTSDEREIALFNVEGTIYALENQCPHAGGPLAEGDVKDGIVTCPWHAWEFNLKTGMCINAPNHCAAIIPISIEGDNITLKQ